MSRASDDEGERGAEISPPATSSQAAWLLSGDIHRPAHAHNRVSSKLWSPQAGACTKGGTPPVSTGLRMHIGSVMGVKLYRHREFLRRGTEFAAEEGEQSGSPTHSQAGTLFKEENSFYQ